MTVTVGPTLQRTTQSSGPGKSAWPSLPARSSSITASAARRPPLSNTKSIELSACFPDLAQLDLLFRPHRVLRVAELEREFGVGVVPIDRDQAEVVFVDLVRVGQAVRVRFVARAGVRHV